MRNYIRISQISKYINQRSYITISVVPQPLIAEGEVDSESAAGDEYTDNTLILSAALSSACALLVCGILMAIFNKARKTGVETRTRRTSHNSNTDKLMVATIAS